MAFGVTRQELNEWKQNVLNGKITYLTHYWLEPRFPGITTVTKVGCANLETLSQWCKMHELNVKHIHHRNDFPHFDLSWYEAKRNINKRKIMGSDSTFWDLIF